jgi:hypothetical protein
LDVYNPICASYEPGKTPWATADFNTLYSSFYMGCGAWTDFKILIDIVLKFNTTEPLRSKVARGMAQLENIRNLIVDLTTFGLAPANVWTGFPKLKKLTIALYAGSSIEACEPLLKLQFVRSQQGTKYGMRADWVISLAKGALEAVNRNHMPEWTPPKLEGVVRISSFDEGEVTEQWTDCEIIDGSDYDTDDDDDWYKHTKAAAAMTSTVSPDEISRLKHKYHLSRKARFWEETEDISASEGDQMIQKMPWRTLSMYSLIRVGEA